MNDEHDTALIGGLEQMARDLERAARRIRSLASLTRHGSDPDMPIRLRYTDSGPGFGTYELDPAHTTANDTGWTSDRWRVVHEDEWSRPTASGWMTQRGHWPAATTEEST